MISPGCFSVFQNFNFLGVRGVKGQKMVLNDKKFCLSCLTSQEPYIIWLWFMKHMQNDNIFRWFFSFFQIFIFWIVKWVKGQKRAQNDKKLCLLYSISEETYIVWLSFMMQMCKMMISPGVFLISIFQVFKGLKGKKMAQNVEHFCLSHIIFQKPCITWSSSMLHMYVQKDNISRHF